MPYTCWLWKSPLNYDDDHSDDDDDYDEDYDDADYDDDDDENDNDDDDDDDGGGSGGDGGGDYDAQLFCRCMKTVAKWQRRGLCQNCQNSEKECGSLIMAANA